MSDDFYAGTMKYNLIYVMEIPDENHKHFLKIGEHDFTSPSSYKQLLPNCDELNKQAKIRIDQFTRTAFVHCNLLYTELARVQVRLSDGTIETRSFSDKDVHSVLDRAGYEVRRFFDTDKPSEWYKVDLPTAIAAIGAIKKGRHTLSAAEMKTGDDSSRTVTQNAKPPSITLRDEQRACVEKTKLVFSHSDRMLWDCKMRFGKTVTAYALVRELGFRKVLVVTHRPAVVDGWRADFKLMFDDERVFVTKTSLKTGDVFTSEDASIDAENDRRLKNLVQSNTPFVYFASMQDLRGSKLAGGSFPKNRAVFDMDWDLIIYDEAHEGTQTDFGKAVQERLEKTKSGKAPKKVLELSGTPYNLLNQYADDNVYQWDYVMEQEAKRRWDENHPGDHNPYADLPEMRICTFDLRQKLSGSYRYEDATAAFNFHEFFRTWTGDEERDFAPVPSGVNVGDFVYAEDVRKFLDLISTESETSHYPFASQETRDMFRHTFWILPGVKEARAMSALLRNHPIFGKYGVVNVAGEGDEEQPYDDALAAVRKAIQKHPKTITLSCGKLTTGVTVREWTAVMLLSGSSSTGAAGYMQTIFRCQSAGSIDGMQKKVCYAFDFAPDRALTVLKEIHQLRAYGTGFEGGQRAALQRFLNFCPVLAESGTGMVPYDVPQMMRQIKRVTVEAALRSGFDDNSIYKADAGIVMDSEKANLIKMLTDRVYPQPQSKKDRKISINRQGLTEEQYQKAQTAKYKPKRERTREEQELLAKEREQRKEQQGLFDLLRNISIRLPLLIFGTATDFNEAVRLEEFVDKVDDQSWKEFMPEKVDKKLFLQLLVFYDQDVIEGAGMRIRHMTKATDEMKPTRRVMKLAEIFACFKNPAKETVLTPWRVVNMHLGDTIGGYNFYRDGYPMKDGLLEKPRLIEQPGVSTDLFLNGQVRILEMNSKSGLYPLYVAYTIYRMLIPKKEEQLTFEEAQKYWRKALEDHLFVLCQTSMAVSITKRTLAGYTDTPVNAIYLSKLLDRMDDKARLAHKLTYPKTWKKEGDRLKFDAVVGNPPYQQKDGGNKASSTPIYNEFVDLAKAIHPSYLSMIMPARWYSGGKGLDSFRESMLKDRRLVVLHDYTDSNDCFVGVDIAGGICYFLWDAKYNGLCKVVNHHQGESFEGMRNLDESRIFIRYQQALSIIHKVQQHSREFYDSRVSSRKPFGLQTYVVPTEDGDIQLRYNKGIGPFRSELVTAGQEQIGMWKVIMSYLTVEHAGRADKEGKKRIFSSIDILKPNVVCTETYLVVDAFESETEAQNLLQYLKTQFVRFLVSQAAITQHISKVSFAFVPVQDFSRSWTDADLYEKYGLSPEEIAFIEANIKPME